MKQHLWIVNLLLLAINIVLFIIFTAYTALGLKPIGNYISTGDIQTQLVIALVYEFCFFIISAVFAKIMNKDLSYKGPDVLKCISKRVIVTVCLVALALIVYTAVYGISAEFAVMAVAMLFSILIQTGITRLLKNS